MAGPKPPVFKQQYVYDYLRSVDAGVNSGTDPLLLQRNQLANFRNGTVRGTFPTHRPAYVNRTLDFAGASFRGAFEQGFFQGAGYYKPDFGAESIIVSSLGRLFQIAIAGDTFTVTEVGISADPNSSTAPQVWMWQAEKWMIVNDSQHLPIFFDGNNSRRSVGASSQVGLLNSFTVPAIGSTVNGTFASTFSGPFNVPLRVTDPGGIKTGVFQAVASGAGFTGYPVTLKNYTQTAAVAEASGSELTSGVSIGSAANNENVGIAGNSNIFVRLAATPSQTSGKVGVFCIVGSAGQFLTGTINSYAPATKTLGVHLDSGPLATTASVTQGTLIVSLDVPSTHVANLSALVTAPAQYGTVSAVLDQAYTGALPQLVFINGKQYQITAVQTPTPSTAIVLLNLSGVETTVFANNSVVTTLSELPAGRMGCYGLGRVWQALTDGRRFIGGDIVGGSSGTATYQKRDAVLKVQENDLLNGGGAFIVPGQVGDIRAMLFTSVLDASLGQGPLSVHTPSTVFSCQAPADRTTWQNLTNPILTESLKGAGGLGQNSTKIFNSDVLMRSLLGISSYIQGRRDFDVWGNVPQSREVDPTLALDPTNLLNFTSAEAFDNRFLMTATPVESQFGVYWTELVALNADPISSLRGKAPSCYDGIWDGLNILQLVKGLFGGVERLFAICVSQDLTKIELVEILKSSDDIFQDNNVTPIVWSYESAGLNFFENDPRKRDFIRLLDGELRVDHLNRTLYETLIDAPHQVGFEVFYKADGWPNWVPWNSWTESFDPSIGDSGARFAMGLGEPKPDEFDETDDQPLREGSTFQFKTQITGHCRVILHRYKGVTVPAIDFARPKG